MTTCDMLSKSDPVIQMPGSKSITHRAIIAACLARGSSVLHRFLECEDTDHTIKALRQVGARIQKDKDRLRIEGRGGAPCERPVQEAIYLGNSGTSFRLLLSVMALCRGDFLLKGTERMHRRPIGPLVSALKQLGVQAACVNQDGCPPVRIHANGIRGGRASVPGDQSSQFLSSLLLTAPCAQEDVEVSVPDRLVSGPYVDMTLHVMDRFGIRVDRNGNRRFKIRAGQAYKAREFTVQGDASSASYFWAAAAVTGRTVATTNIQPWEDWQGDLKFLDILEEMGCVIEKGTDHVAVQGRELAGVEADMGDLPDMAPTLAAVGLFARGRTIIRNAAHLRHKESDRLHALTVEWRRLGGRVQELADGLVIEGEAPLQGAVADPHNDHRLAMSLAVAGLRVPGLIIRDRDCVGKSFPGFWHLWETLLAQWGRG